MEKRLKLEQVILHGRLNRSAVRYALQFPALLPGMPEAGSPGRHRQFSLEQAFRLAVCAHLQMAGISLKVAGESILWLEQELLRRHIRGWQFPGKLSSNASWILAILDSEFLRLSSGNTTVPTGKAWLHLPSAGIIDGPRDPVASYQLDLSHLRASLKRGALEPGIL